MVGRGLNKTVLLSERGDNVESIGMLVWWGEVNQERWRKSLQKGRTELQSGRNGRVEGKRLPESC